MENIKLTNGSLHPAKDFMQFGESLKLTVCGITDYQTFRSELTPESLALIEIYSEGGALCTVFEGYTQVTGKFDIVETETGLDITAYLKKPDEMLTRLMELEAEVKSLKETQSA